MPYAPVDINQIKFDDGPDAGGTDPMAVPVAAPDVPAAPVGDFSGLVEAGNIDLTKRPKVKTPDGRTATVRSSSFNIDGKETLLPTVSDDGRLLSDEEAVQQYKKTGKHLGKFDTPDDADKYAQSLHEQQAKYYGLDSDQKAATQSAPKGFVPVDMSAIKLDGAGAALAAPAPSPENPENGNFFQRVGADYDKRVGKAQAAADAGIAGDQSMPETYAQMALNGGAGMVGDVVSQATKSIGRGIYNVAPDISQALIDGGKLAAKGAGNLPMIGGGNMKEGVVGAVNEYDQFAKDHPRAARNIDAVGNAIGVAGAFTPVGASGKTAAGIAKQIAEGTLETGAKVAAAPLKGAAGGVKNIARGVGARSKEELEQAANGMKQVSRDLYTQSRNAGAVLSDKSARDVLRSIVAVTPTGTTKAQKTLYKNTITALGGLAEDIKAGNVSLDTLDQHRQILGNLAKDIANPNRAQEAEAAGNAVRALDDAVDNLTSTNLVTGDRNAIDALQSARAQWSKAKKFEAVSDIINKADGNQANIKNGFKRFLDNKKNLIGFTPEEIKIMRAASRNNMSEKIMKGLGRFGIEPQNVFLPVVTGGLAATAGSGGIGGALIGAGTVARQGNKYLARGKAENVLRAIEDRPVAMPSPPTASPGGITGTPPVAPPMPTGPTRPNSPIFTGKTPAAPVTLSSGSTGSGGIMAAKPDPAPLSALKSMPAPLTPSAVPKVLIMEKPPAGLDDLSHLDLPDLEQPPAGLDDAPMPKAKKTRDPSAPFTKNDNHPEIKDVVSKLSKREITLQDALDQAEKLGYNLHKRGQRSNGSGGTWVFNEIKKKK